MKVLLLGLSYFFEDAAEFGFEKFNIRTGSRKADIVLPRSLYSATELVEKAREKGFEPDMVFLGDESSPPWVYGLEELNVPVIWYAVDTHIHHAWHVHYCAAFDVIFMAQQGYEKLFSVYNNHGILQFAPLYSPGVPPDSPGTHDGGAVFVGNMDPEIHHRRREFFLKLQDICNISLETGPYLPHYLSAKIVLNHSSHDEINFRVFEALYSGAMLITDRAYGLEDLFEDKRHLVIFDSWNVEQAAGLIEYYLGHDAERGEIAAEGQRLVHDRHTRPVRMKEAAGFLSAVNLNNQVEKRLEKQSEINALMKNAFMHWSAHELLDEKARMMYARIVE